MGSVLGGKKYKRSYKHNPEFCHGYAERQNRPYTYQMEDQASFAEFKCIVDGVPKDGKFWAVFDGHNGWTCSLHCAENFGKQLVSDLENIESEIKVEEIVRNCICSFDRQIRMNKVKGGCVAVMCLQIDHHVWFIHSGDSRAVLIGQHEIHLADNSEDPWGAQVNFRDDWTEWKIVDIQQNKQVSRTGLGQQTTYQLHGLNNNLILTEETQDDVKKALASGASCNLILRSVIHQTKDHTPVSCREEIVERVRRNMEFGVLQKAGWNEENCIQGEGKFAKILGTIGCARGFGDFDLTTPTKIKIPLKPFLTVEPEFNYFNLKEIHHDCYVVMACDGIWDEVEINEVVAMADETNKEDSLQRIIDLARTRGSHDDCTCFLIPLEYARKPKSGHGRVRNQ